MFGHKLGIRLPPDVAKRAYGASAHLENVPYCRAVDLKLEGTWPKPRTKLTLKILSGKKADYGSYMLSEGERAGLKRPGFR